MNLEPGTRRWLGGATGLLLVVVILGLYGGDDGGPVSMGAFSLAFATTVAFLALGGVGTFDPDIPHEWLKLEMPRWAWVVILVPFAAVAATMAWWTFSPATPLDYPGMQ